MTDDTPEISVFIPTHNPHPGRLTETLEGLRAQSLAPERWELILVDNASDDTTPLEALNLSWHPKPRIIRENRIGLTSARLRGFAETTGDLIVMVDDDNILRSDYLERAREIFEKHPDLGLAGGKSLPRFESEPPAWIREFWTCLALRDQGEKEWLGSWSNGSRQSSRDDLFECLRHSPVGAGMVLRRSVAENYAGEVKRRRRPIMDRTGKSLTSGGDNDIVLTALESGWQIGYFPELQLTHIIPEDRLQPDYLADLNHASFKSYLAVLDQHGISLWPRISSWTVLPRKAKAWFAHRAWKNDLSYIHWRGACGQFEGRAALRPKRT